MLILPLLFMGFCVYGVQSRVLLGPIEEIKGGEYVYYNLSAVDNYVFLTLNSLSGDCDVYLSEKVESPTYKDYTLQCATCGVDTIIIPKSFKRPIHVGIYGHPSFDVSECQISICLLDVGEADEFTDEVTEISALTDAVIKENCIPDRPTSLLQTCLKRVSTILEDLDFGSTIVEVLAIFLQAVI